MNRDKLELWVLLDEAGELNAFRRWRLHRALARDRELADFRAASLELARISRAASPESPLPAATLGAIRQEAAAASLQRRAPAAEHRLLRPALAVAAALAVTVAGALLYPRGGDRDTELLGGIAAALPSEWNALDDDLAELDQLLAATSDTFDASPEEEEALARELLQLEGMQI